MNYETAAHQLLHRYFQFSVSLFPFCSSRDSCGGNAFSVDSSWISNAFYIVTHAVSLQVPVLGGFDSEVVLSASSQELIG